MRAITWTESKVEPQTKKTKARAEPNASRATNTTPGRGQSRTQAAQIVTANNHQSNIECMLECGKYPSPSM